MDEGPLENTFIGNHLILAPWRPPLYGGIAARRSAAFRGDARPASPMSLDHLIGGPKMTLVVFSSPSRIRSPDSDTSNYAPSFMGR